MKLREPEQERKSPFRWIGRLLLLLFTVSACFIASVFLFSRWQEARLGGIAQLDGGESGRNPLELLYLQSYLALNAESLQQPVGAGKETVIINIEPGETAEMIADRLSKAGLLHDVELFQRYVQYVGLDGQLEVGKYLLSPDMSIPDLALALTQAGVTEIELSFLNGWRLAEMVEYLAAVRPANIDPRVFANLAEGRIKHDLSSYSFLDSKPDGSSLEGYLFPGSYVVPVDADAAYLFDSMLTGFGEQVREQLIVSFERNGLTIHDAVTLASIIEKETKVTAEMPLMASVYTNRLSIGERLQADPTVQYVIGYDPGTDSWWKSPLALDDLSIESPYNTYLYPGLPPGPITNPALASLQAVAAPAQTDFLFFVADCNADIAGSHVFSRTFEEHLAYVNQCRE